MDKISHIVVPINGNSEDEVALSLATNVSKRNKAKITVITVVEVKRSLPLDADLPVETAHGEKLLDWAEEQARHLDCKIEIELLQARTAGAALVDEVNALHVDLIIIGLPYRAHFGEFHLGETSNYILNHATCKVWLVRDKNNPSMGTLP
jgi:nucleotide-binding universal stress UspA family protein